MSTGDFKQMVTPCSDPFPMNSDTEPAPAPTPEPCKKNDPVFLTNDPAPTPRTDASYVVTAYRWGQRNAHSYVVGSFSDLNRAKQCADEHVDYRGGKYACEVAQAGSWSEDDDDVARQVYYVESPYYGMAHDCGHFHPADCAKRGRPSAKPFTVRELQNALAAKDAEIERLNMDNHMLTVRATNAEKCADGRLARAEKAEAELELAKQERDEAERDEKELWDMLHRVCQEGFGYDDTKGGEYFDDYLLREIAQLRAALEVAREALETLAKNDNYGAGKQFVTYVHVCNFAEQAIARIDAIIHVRKCSQSLQK